MLKGWWPVLHPCSKRWAPQGAVTVLCSQPTSAFHHGFPRRAAGRALPGAAEAAATTKSQKLSSPQGISPLLANRNRGFSLMGCGKLLLTARRPWLLDHFGLSCCNSYILAVGWAERSLLAGCALLAPLHAPVSRASCPTHGRVSADARAGCAVPSRAQPVPAFAQRRRG